MSKLLVLFFIGSREAFFPPEGLLFPSFLCVFHQRGSSAKTRPSLRWAYWYRLESPHWGLEHHCPLLEQPSSLSTMNRVGRLRVRPLNHKSVALWPWAHDFPWPSSKKPGRKGHGWWSCRMLRIVGLISSPLQSIGLLTDCHCFGTHWAL